LLTTFYNFDTSFKKTLKSDVSLKSEKNVKYVFSNTGQDQISRAKCDGILERGVKWLDVLNERTGGYETDYV